jgi:hypothetical protein
MLLTSNTQSVALTLFAGHLPYASLHLVHELPSAHVYITTGRLKRFSATRQCLAPFVVRPRSR